VDNIYELVDNTKRLVDNSCELVDNTFYIVDLSKIIFVRSGTHIGALQNGQIHNGSIIRRTHTVESVALFPAFKETPFRKKSVCTRV